MDIIYSNDFIDDLKVQENTILMGEYGFSLGDSIDQAELEEGTVDDVWGRTDGLHILNDDGVLKICLDFKGINIISDKSSPGEPKLGWIDIVEDTIEPEYMAIYFFYSLLGSTDKKLAFTLVENSGEDYITTLCVTRNIFEISLPYNSSKIIGSKEDSELDFLEGPGKEVGENLYSFGEPEDMVSRGSYYKYIRIENSLIPPVSELSWNSGGTRNKVQVYTRVYKGLQIDFGNFTKDSDSNILIRDLPNEDGSFDLHGVVEYSEYNQDGEETSKGKLSLERIPGLAIEVIDSQNFDYTIDNFLKSIRWRKKESYILPYGIFRVHLPGDLYSEEFKIVLGIKDAIWTFNPETADTERDGIPVITLNGTIWSTKSVSFTTTLPREYLSTSNCYLEFGNEVLEEYFTYYLDFLPSGKEGVSRIEVTFETLKDNIDVSWVPQDDQGNPYPVTFKCSFDGYSQSMYIAQYPKTPSLMILDGENQFVDEYDYFMIPSSTLFSDFAITIQNNSSFTTWKIDEIHTKTSYTLQVVDSYYSNTPCTSGKIYNMTGDTPQPPSETRYYFKSNISGDSITEEIDLGYVDFYSIPNIDPTLSMSDFTIDSENSQTVTIDLIQGSLPVLGFQTDLILPAGLSIQGKPVAIEGTLEGDSTPIVIYSDGKLLVYNNDGLAFKGDTKSTVTITFLATPDFTEGSITLENTVINLVGDIQVNAKNVIARVNPSKPSVIEEVPEWRKKVGRSNLRVKIHKEPTGPKFYYNGDTSGYYISSISLENVQIYKIPIYTNRRFTATIITNEGNTGEISFDTQEMLSTITLPEASGDLILYNWGVDPSWWENNIGETRIAGTLQLRSSVSSLPEPEREYNIPIIRYSLTDSSRPYILGGDFRSEFPIKYAVEYNPSYQNSAPWMNRFGVIDNVFENPQQGDGNPVSRFVDVYFASSTNIVSISSLSSVGGYSAFYGSSQNSYVNYFDSGHNTNQKATVKVLINKDNLTITDFYFPVPVVGYIKFENLDPENKSWVGGKKSNAVGCLFMKPFDNLFWYKIDSGEWKSGLNAEDTILFEDTANDSHTLIIQSRYPIDFDQAVYLSDGFVGDTKNFFSGTSTYIAATRSAGTGIPPAPENNYCLNSTTYTFVTYSANSGPYAVFERFTLSPKVTNSPDLNKFVRNVEDLEGIYENQEVGYHGERYNSTIAKRSTEYPGGLMSNSNPTWKFNLTLVQKGSEIGSVSISSDPVISGGISKTSSSGKFILLPTPDVEVTRVYSEGSRISIGELGNNQIDWEIWGIIQSDRNSGDYLWSAENSGHPNVFDYSGITREVRAALSAVYKSKYDENINPESTTQVFEATQYGYQVALYFYFEPDNFERFGIGQSTGETEVLDTSQDIGKISGKGEDLEFLIGSIGISSSGPLSDTIGEVTIDRFYSNDISGEEYIYDPEAVVSRGLGNNLILHFPQNSMGYQINYFLECHDSENSLIIKFTQDKYIEEITFCNQEGTPLEDKLEILSDGTIYKGSGIGNVGGNEYGVLYFKTNMLESRINSLQFKSIPDDIQVSSYTPPITKISEGFYRVELSFSPNRLLNNITDGELQVSIDGGNIIKQVPLCQYYFSIELQYYFKNGGSPDKITGRTQPTNESRNPFFYLQLYDEGIDYTFTKKENYLSCFLLTKIKYSTPGSTPEGNTYEVDVSSDNPVLSDRNLYIHLYNDPSSGEIKDLYFTNPRMEVILDNTSSLANSPYVWFTYISSSQLVTTDTIFQIEFNLKVIYPGGGDLVNYQNLPTDEQNRRYQTFTYQYSAKKLSES